jgi:hypothetical protein
MSDKRQANLECLDRRSAVSSFRVAFALFESVVLELLMLAEACERMEGKIENNNG